MAKYMIGIDLGATNAKLGIVSISKRTIVRSISAPLSDKYREAENICSLLFSMASHLLDQTSKNSSIRGQSITSKSQEVNTKKPTFVITNGVFIPPTTSNTRETENSRDVTDDDLVRSLNISYNNQVNQVKLSFADIEGLGVGCPGHIEEGIVRAASNFPSWKDVNLAYLLEEKFSKPVALNNDADAAIAGEVWAGNAREKKNVVMITLGSGVGTGMVIGGKLMTGRRGLVEGGHMIVEGKSGRACGCGQKGCLEQYCSANGIARIARERINYHIYALKLDESKAKKANISLSSSNDTAIPSGDNASKVKEVAKDEKNDKIIPPLPPTSEELSPNSETKLSLPEDGNLEQPNSEQEGIKYMQPTLLDKIVDMPDNIERNRKIESLTTRDLFVAYLQDQDEFAKDVIEGCMHYLAIGCINICRIVDPDVILLSGGLTEAGSVLINVLKECIKNVGWTILPNEIDIQFASLGSKTGILGAAAAAKLA